jgi:hypothetical protein
VTVDGRRRGVRIALLLVLLLAFTAQQYGSGQLIRALAVDLIVLIVAVHVLWPRTRWLLPGTAPLLAAGLLAQTVAQAEVHARVAVPAVLGCTFLILLALGVDVGRRVDAAVQVGGRWLEMAIGVVAFALVVLPGWAWTRLRRRDALDRAPRGWSDPTGTRASPASLASSPEVLGGRRTLFGRLTWAVGCVILLMAVDLGLGMGWDRAFPTSETTAAATSSGPGIDQSPLPRDPRNDVPAMAAYPWRERYFDDIQRTGGGYWPFTEYRPSDFTSPYVNQRGWLRTSYQPEGDPATMPRVWMFGGSTTWGEGQRDQYTIASWISRIAEEEGTPLRIDNYGQRGWTHYQEMILYDQQLALRTPPDLAIFYDGLNEITTQSLLEEPVPAHPLVQAYAKKLTGATVATELVQDRSASEGVTVRQLYQEYEERSAASKLVQWFRGSPAGASPTQEDDDDAELDPAFTENQEAQQGAIQNYDLTEQDGIDAGKVYEQGKVHTSALSELHDVEALFFWQPAGWNGPAQLQAIAQLSDSTIDISEALADHEEVFIDGGHTNEEGARIMAVEIWKHLQPSVEAWYEEQR